MGVLDEMEAFFDEDPVVTSCSFQCLPWVRIKDYSQKTSSWRWPDMYRTGELCRYRALLAIYIFRERKDLVSVFLEGDVKARIAEN